MAAGVLVGGTGTRDGEAALKAMDKRVSRVSDISRGLPIRPLTGVAAAVWVLMAKVQAQEVSAELQTRFMLTMVHSGVAAAITGGC